MSKINQKFDNKLYQKIESTKPFKIRLYAFIGIIFLGLIDVITGYQLSFAIFYVAPITVAAYFVNKNTGIFMSVFSSIVWLIADHFSRDISLPIYIYIWNASTRLIFFITITLCLAKIRNVYEQERAYSRIDHLTGAANSRSFYEFSNNEIEKTNEKKSPFSLAHLDVDHFKQVNDTLGHLAGDNLLINITTTIKQNLRKSDLVARLGGDEFALFLPNTDKDTALLVLKKIQSKLMEMVSEKQFPVSFSIGMITCYDTPKSIDEILKQADEMMYAVKKNGKNNIQTKVI